MYMMYNASTRVFTLGAIAHVKRIQYVQCVLVLRVAMLQSNINKPAGPSRSQLLSYFLESPRVPQVQVKPVQPPCMKVKLA